MYNENTQESNKIDKEFTEIKIDNIKHFVDNQLDKLGLYDKIKHFIDDNVDDTDEDRIMQKIREAGFIDEILENFKVIDKKPQIDNTKKCLYLKLISGKGF